MDQFDRYQQHCAKTSRKTSMIFKFLLQKFSLALSFLVLPSMGTCADVCAFDHASAASAIARSDYSSARHIYQSAANCGNAEALYNLGVIAARGLDGNKDEEKAINLYQESADSGYLEAQNNLGIMHFFGRGTPVDHVLGDMWFQIAAKGGHTGATNNDAAARTKMSRDEVARASAMAEDWIRRSSR